MAIKEQDLKLYKQIVNVHYSTDYSSIDRIYPPFFVWDKNKNKQTIKYFKKARRIKKDYDLYIHFPYCEKKCWFCRHCSFEQKSESQLSEYLAYLKKEIKLYGKIFDKPRIGHIYFGGGTPTLFNLEEVKSILTENFTFLPEHQINVESTFSVLDEDKIKVLKKIGVNRLVLGVQSFDQKVLARINRAQNQEYFKKIYQLARRAGIETINAELMGGLPGQTYESFMSDLQFLIDIGLDSIHIYSYMQTPKTVLGQINKFKVDNELKIKMIKDGEALLEKKGFTYYGDDYARERIFRNKSIMRLGRLGVDKLALGVSAVGFVTTGKWRVFKYLNTADLCEYKEKLDKKEFPIYKSCYLKKEDILRSLIVDNLRFLDLNIIDASFKKELLFKFKKEFAKLKKTCKVKERNGEIEVRDWLVNSKIFYSKKVIKKCKKVISEDYPDIPEEIII